VPHHVGVGIVDAEHVEAACVCGRRRWEEEGRAAAFEAGRAPLLSAAIDASVISRAFISGFSLKMHLSLGISTYVSRASSK
jgi:hypothetical protein